MLPENKYMSPTTQNNGWSNIKLSKTRKSSCVNARGIPTATYQVLHLLTEVGYPPLGYPPVQVWQGGTWGTPHWGTPPPVQVWWGRVPRVPPPPSGYPPVGVPPIGVPLQVWQGGTWGTPPSGYPSLSRSDGGYLGYPPIGVPPIRVPPLGVDWQTKWNYYLPSRTTYAVSNNVNGGVGNSCTSSVVAHPHGAFPRIESPFCIMPWSLWVSYQ